ncbi:MAG: ImmA/IrrE family metallo-endopeptidase [Burkholderiales bacterium]
MSDAAPLNSFKAAAKILTWLDAMGSLTLPIDLELVRQMLPDTPFGRGTSIKKPADLTWNASEGALVRNSENHAEWGIFVNPKARAERRRFTVAHELGHFVLHRATQATFNCDKESVYTGIDTLKAIEREADDFASNLLMPGNMLRDRIDGKRIDIHLLGALAKEFGVSLEAMCIRLVKYTEQRAVLVYWDNGFLKYQWPSGEARRTRVRLRKTADPQEPILGTLAADEEIAQEWDGVDMPASAWCTSEASDIRLRELKHTYADGNRVLSLLMLESAPPRTYHASGWEEEQTRDTFDRFVDNGQPPVR